MSAAPQTDGAPLIERSHHIMVLTSDVAAREGVTMALVTHLAPYGAGFRLNLEQDGVEIVITHAGAKARSAGVELPIDPHEAKQILEDLRMALRKCRKKHPEALALVDSAVRSWVTDVTHEVSEDPELTIVTDGPHGAIKKLTARIVGRDFTGLTIVGHQSYTACDQHGDEIAEPLAGQALQWLITYHTNAGRLSAGLRQAIEDLYGALADQWAALNPDDPEDDDLDEEAEEQLEELTTATLEAAELGGEPEQASIIDVPEPKADPVSRAAIIPLGWLTLDERCQPRTGIDEATVARYVEAIQSGATLPPIEVVVSIKERPIWVIDGWHRVEAHKRLKRQSIMAIRHKGELRDAIWRATSANATNGLQRSQADLARAIAILLDDPEWSALSDRRLSRHVGCSDKTIGNHKRRRALEASARAHEASARAHEEQEALSERSSPPQEVLSPTAEIRTPETTRHGTIERTTTTAAPERCTQTLDLVEMLAPSTQAEAPEDAPSSDEWYTPKPIIELARVILGGIGLDPASCSVAQEVVKADTYWTAQDNALLKDWGAVGARTVWLNPPYSRRPIMQFTNKFLDEYEDGSFEEALVLVNVSSSATWWQDLALQAQLIAYPDRRITFWRAGGTEEAGNRYDSSMMYFGAPEDARMVAATLRSCDWLVTSGGGT